MRFLSLLLLALLPPAQEYKGAEEKLPADPGPQPVAFSHRQHAEAQLKCADCHATAATADAAGMPATAKCMACHRAIQADSPEIQKLAAFHRKDGKAPWVRVYRVRDFVFFSHTNHLKAGAECQTCHGPVATRDVLLKEVSTNMAACVNCHRERKASTDCSLCHQLGQ